MRTRRRWPIILAAVAIVLVCVAIVAVIATTAWVQQHLTVHERSRAEAEVEFALVRQRFAHRPPVLELTDGRARYHPGVSPAPAGTPPLETLHILVWDPEDRQLLRFALPFWFLRLKSGPITFSAYASGLDDNRLSVRTEDIEKFGPGLLLDATVEKGTRVLLWTD